MKNFTLSANTLSRTVKDNPADRIEVEIGDSKQPDFKSQFKIKRWDNEVNFSMRAIEEAGATMVEEDDKVKYKGKEIEVHQYEKPDAGEDGGFEFEWVLNKKPKSNVLRTTIQHKGLDFFYQPALTAEEIEQGASRDENVVGSYAVYHKTKKDNIVGGIEYKTGKAFHIYRPHAVDAKGLKVWCELDITDGELTVTVPEDFLNKASYPVVVDPTFGYTSVGGSSLQLLYNTYPRTYHIGTHLSASANGTLDSLHIAYLSTIDFVADGSLSATFQAVLSNENSGGTSVHGQVEAIIQTGITGMGTAAFVTFTSVTNSSIVNGNEYIISTVGDLSTMTSPSGTNKIFRIVYDSVSHDRWYFDGNSATYPSPTPWTKVASTNGNRPSVYATYTASGGVFNPAFAHRRLLL